MAVAATPRHLGATVLLGKGLTPGKLRGLQRISNPNGTLTMLALDQNSSMIEMAHKALKTKGLDREPSYEEIVEAKLDLMRQMAPAASGVLIDGYYGAWSAIASEAIPPDRGMLVRVEKSGSPKNAAGAPMAEIEPGWSVEKIKLMGADAVKLLAPFEPNEPISAEHQFQFIEQVYADCKRFDILLLLETVAFPFGGEKKTDAGYLDRKAETVIESARQLSRYCDVYKAEFPGWLDQASRRPAPRQPARPGRRERAPLGLAVGGRRLLAVHPPGPDGHGVGGLGHPRRPGVLEGVLPPGRRRRRGAEFAATTGRQRVAEADAIVRQHATPWFARYGLSKDDLATIRASEGWHARYAPHARQAGGTGGHAVRAGEVY